MERKLRGRDAPLVLVEWSDSFGCGSRWGDIDLPHESTGVQVCRSAGWLAYDGDDYKLVIPHISLIKDEDEPDQGCGDMAIPSAAVISITRLQQGDPHVR